MQLLTIPLLVTDTAPENADKLLAACYEKLLATERGMLSGQTEKYDNCDLVMGGRRIALCSIRINDAHRLFYVIVNDCLVPLEVVWNHRIDKSIFANKENTSAREKAVLEIQEALTRQPQETVVAASPKAYAENLSSPKTTTSPKKKSISFNRRTACHIAMSIQSTDIVCASRNRKNRDCKS